MEKKTIVWPRLNITNILTNDAWWWWWWIKSKLSIFFIKFKFETNNQEDENEKKFRPEFFLNFVGVFFSSSSFVYFSGTCEKNVFFLVFHCLFFFLCFFLHKTASKKCEEEEKHIDIHQQKQKKKERFACSWWKISWCFAERNIERDLIKNYCRFGIFKVEKECVRIVHSCRKDLNLFSSIRYPYHIRVSKWVYIKKRPRWWIRILVFFSLSRLLFFPKFILDWRLSPSSMVSVFTFEHTLLDHCCWKYILMVCMVYNFSKKKH